MPALRLVLVPRAVPVRFVVSAALHAALLAAWVWAPARTVSFEPSDAPVVGLVAGPPGTPGPSAPAPPAPPDPVPPPEPAGPSVQPEPEPPKPKKEEPKKPEEEPKKPERPEPKTDPDARRSPPSPQPPGTGAPGSSTTPGTSPNPGAGGPQGLTLSIGGGQPGSDFYNASVKAAVDSRWRRPVLDATTRLQVTLTFEVLRDGTVRNVQVSTSSGVAALDRSAQRAVLEASPLPPFPSVWRGPSASATITFDWTPE